MESLANKIKILRKEAGYSQQFLANKAEISLALMQNIEADKANPSWNNIGRIFSALGVSISLQPLLPDWDLLIELGLPLNLSSKKKIIFEGKELLPSQIIRAAKDLEINNEERKKIALESLLLALKTHYSSFYKKYLEFVPIVQKYIPKIVSGKHIKLSKVALSVLSTYL